MQCLWVGDGADRHDVHHGKAKAGDGSSAVVRQWQEARVGQARSNQVVLVGSLAHLLELKDVGESVEAIEPEWRARWRPLNADRGREQGRREEGRARHMRCSSPITCPGSAACSIRPRRLTSTRASMSNLCVTSPGR